MLYIMVMIRIALSEIDREAINEALDDPSIDERQKRKLLALRMHDLNVPHQKIAQLLNISDDTVTNYLKAYEAEGLAGILENRHYKPLSQAVEFFEQIKKSLDEHPVATGKEAADRIKKITGIDYSESQARRIMKKLGFKCRKTGSIPGKADPQLQMDFLTDELLPRLEEARNGDRKVFFVDAAHFVWGAFLGMVWCFTRIFIRTGSGRKRYNVLGAVETKDHDWISVQTTGSINAQVVIELIKKIHRKYSKEEITLVMDNARYQYNAEVRALAESLGIELLYLPPYSPNLNLIERVWKLVKSKCLRNKYYENFDDFQTAIDEFVYSMKGKNKILLKSLITENFSIHSTPKIECCKV